MIIIILKMIFLTTLWTLGWKVLISKGMLLEKLGEWAEKKVEEGHKIYDGLIVCQWCVPNIHGLLFVWPIAIFLKIIPVWQLSHIMIYPFCVAGSSFLSGILWEFYLTLTSRKEYYKDGALYYTNAQKYYYNINKKEKDENKGNSKSKQ